MDRAKKVFNRVLEQGLLPMYYHADPVVSVGVLRALYRAGYRAVEYASQSENALDNFLLLRKALDIEFHDLLLGVGNVKSKIDATEFINEGADFIVCPGLSEEVMVLAHKNHVLWIPTCATTNEIMQAEDLGAKLVKLFPAGLLGPSYVTAAREMFPDLLFIPTGGIEMTPEDLQPWFKRGTGIAGLSSRLIHDDLLEARNYTAIESTARTALETVQRIRRS